LGFEPQAPQAILATQKLIIPAFRKAILRSRRFLGIHRKAGQSSLNIIPPKDRFRNRMRVKYYIINGL
jgi:hypothetical protein